MKHLSIAVIFVAAVLALPFVYSRTHGYTAWWFRRSATVTVNGNSNGFLDRRLNDSELILTRTDTSPHQSNLVAMSERKFLIHCGEWSAPSWPVFPMGHVNPPCSAFSNGADDSKADNPVSSTLVVQRNSVEFTTTSGKGVKPSW
jgi:hypothetical protein